MDRVTRGSRTLARCQNRASEFLLTRLSLTNTSMPGALIRDETAHTTLNTLELGNDFALMMVLPSGWSIDPRWSRWPVGFNLVASSPLLQTAQPRRHRFSALPLAGAPFAALAIGVEDSHVSYKTSPDRRTAFPPPLFWLPARAVSRHISDLSRSHTHP